MKNKSEEVQINMSLKKDETNMKLYYENDASESTEEGDLWNDGANNEDWGVNQLKLIMEDEKKDEEGEEERDSISDKDDS